MGKDARACHVRRGPEAESSQEGTGVGRNCACVHGEGIIKETQPRTPGESGSRGGVYSSRFLNLQLLHKFEMVPR